MANKISFILKNAKSTNETLIRLRLLCKDGLFDYSTMQKVVPADWNFTLQRSYTDASVNEELNRFKRLVVAYIELQKSLGNPVLKDKLKQELDISEHRSKKCVEVKPVTIYSYVEKLAQEAREGKLLTPQNTIYTEGTIKNWERSSLLLCQYIPDLTYDGVTLEAYYGFINFCNQRNYSPNFIGKTIKDWKRFMELGYFKGWHNNIIHKNPRFKKLKEVSYQVYLDTKEIQQLIDLDLSANRYQRVIRDRFVINLYTGFRISDMQTLTTENIENGTIIHINQKTNKKVVVPIHPIVQEIINKYGGSLPKQYSDQVVNREIKKIAQAAGITERVRYTKTEGGRKKQFIKEKWQMISNHTSRRSMATNLLKKVDTVSAMLVLGMSSRTLDGYNKRTPEENAELLKSNNFFQR